MEKLTDVLNGSEFLATDYMPLVYGAYGVTAAILSVTALFSLRGLYKAAKALEKLQ